MKYLKQFFSGANIIVVLPFYLAVYYSKNKNYSFFQYSIVSPIWFGLFNVLSYIIAKKYNLSLFQRFTLISTITSIIIMILSTKFKTYNYSKNQWIKYYIGIFIKYMLVWHLLIKNIEQNI
jgi:hypothetical protein